MTTFVQFANDECDYGMGLELGLDLFCYGSHVSNSLPLYRWTYNLKFKHRQKMNSACIQDEISLKDRIRDRETILCKQTNWFTSQMAAVARGSPS